MSRPDKVTKCLVDGDVITYRASASADSMFCDKCNKKVTRKLVSEGFVCQCGCESFHPDEVETALEKVDDLMGYIEDSTVEFATPMNFETYLTGTTNFRHHIAKTHGYKANRVGPKPVFLKEARDHLESNYGAVISVNCEADDLISTEVMNNDPNTTVIASVDKDFQTVSCWWFNFPKGEFKFSTEWDASMFFYEQVLTGDRVDNIIGLHGIGPKKAQKILEGSSSEEELFQKCVDAYDGDIDRVVENARLLHLQRWEGQVWTPPTERVT